MEELPFTNMKSVVVGYSLFFIACFDGVLSQRVQDAEPSGRRGDVLTMGDVADQTVFNIDNTGGGGGGAGGGGGGGSPSGGGGPLDCAKIIAECQCGRVPSTHTPQMAYNSYHGYNNR